MTKNPSAFSGMTGSEFENPVEPMSEPGYRIKQLRRRIYRELNCHINLINDQKTGE